MSLPTTHITRTKLKGTSLFFALTFTLVIAVTITSIIGLVFLHNEYVARTLKIGDRIDLVQKASFLAENKLEVEEINALLSSINTTSDSIQVSKKVWGIYDIHRFDFRNTSEEIVQSHVAMMGYHASEVSTIGTFLKEEYNPLIVAGTTKLEGTTYLTKSEVKPGSIEGYGYRYDDLLFGDQVIHGNERTFEFTTAFEIKTVFDEAKANATIVQDSIIGRWEEDPIVLRMDSMRLSNVYISGHVYLIANNKLVIDKGVSIEHAVLIAPEIQLQSELPLQLQAFASEFIEVQSGSILSYPSALVLTPLIDKPITLEVEKANLIIHEGSEVAGVLIAGKGSNSLGIGKITLKEDVQFQGMIFNQGPTELHSDIKGSVFTHNFEHKSERGRRYVNYLFDVQINPDKVGEYILYPEFKDFATQKKVLTWL